MRTGFPGDEIAELWGGDVKYIHNSLILLSMLPMYTYNTEKGSNVTTSRYLLCRGSPK